MQRFKRYQKAAVATVGALALLFCGAEGKAATWQEELQSHFDIVDTFDQLQDWTPGGQWYSAAGCATCASNSTLPKKTDGTPSIWGLWNNKGLSFEYTPQSGTFVKGDVITGATSGATATVRRVWNLNGKWYIQLTNSNASTGSSNLRAGEKITSGTKVGANLAWPLFIGNHGPAYSWGGSGKSLVLDIGDNNNTDPANPTMAGLGAQRMATYFGDGVTGKSGYKKIYAFFMMKVSPDFFPKCQSGSTGCVSGGYEPVSVVKVFDLDSGFTGVSKWGTATEAAQVGGANAYRINEYGLNFSVFNFGGGGLSYPQNLFFAENVHVASGTSGSYTYTQTVSSRKVRSGTTTDINSYVAAGEWFGVEVASDIGTKGNADGSTDVWIYDKNGAEMGHWAVKGEKRLMYFDHFYNKFVLGGNRLSSNGKTGNIDSRWWIDDLIIHGSRIGTTYFQLFANRGAADTTAPSAVITSPVANATVSGVTTVSVNATDNVGVSKVELYVNGVLKDSGTAGPFTWDTTTVANGSYNLSAKVYDAAGNVGNSALLPVKVYNGADAVAPVVSITSPVAGSSVSGTVNVAVNATDNIAVSKVELYVNGTVYGVYGTSPYNIPWNTTAYAPGSYTLTAKAYDAAGNLGQSGAVSVMVGATTTTVPSTAADTTAPVITTFTMPVSATSPIVPVTFAATDNVGVTGYRISENSGSPLPGWDSWVATRPTSFTFAGTGTRTAYAWAKDAAGKVSAVASATVNIAVADTTAPAVTAFTMPATARSFTVPISSFTGSDNTKVTGYLVTGSSTRPYASATGWSSTPPTQFTFSSTGYRTAYAWVKDAAGNVSASRSATVIVDGTAPTITSVSPTGGTYALNSTIHFVGSASDAIALSKMTISVDGTLKYTVSGGSLSYYWKATTRGSHLVKIAAYDKAGNSTVKNIYISVP